MTLRLAHPEASTRVALEEAAWKLYALRPPADLTARTIAAAADCSHGMITAGFGGKAGLEAAVSSRLADVLERQVAEACQRPGLPFDGLVAAARHHPRVRRLLVRAGLGDLPIQPLLDVSTIGTCLVERIEEMRGGNPRRPTRRSRLAAYGVLCLLFGFYTFEEFFNRATGADAISQSTRDTVIVEALSTLAALAGDPTAHLDLPRRRADVGDEREPRSAARGRVEVREALVEAAITLLATRGPAAITTREIAERAGVQHGLIHRHFGSKEALLTAALDRSIVPVLDQALRARLMDIPALTRVTRRALQPWILARLISDSVDVFETRPATPVVAALLETYPDVPTGEGPGNLTDARMALLVGTLVVHGSAVWDQPARQLAGLPTDQSIDIDVPVAEFAERLLSVPRRGLAGSA